MEENNKSAEDKINEAEIQEVEMEEKKQEETPKKKRKTDFYIELVLFLILGILIGIAVKTEASKKITIGFDDYKMKIKKQDYNINQLQTDLAKAGTDQENAADEGQNVPGEESEPGTEPGQVDGGNPTPSEVPSDANQGQ